MKWITAARGVRYYKHGTRKHGIRPDRYFTIYSRRAGKQVFEKIGWASEGWTLEKVLDELNQLKANYRTGSGPVTLQEKRELEQARKENERIKSEQLGKDSMTFSSLFEIYLEQQKADGKKTWSREQELFKCWIQPVIGKLRLIDIAPIHYERIKSNMKAGSKRKNRGGLSARTIHYCLAVCRQVFNFGKKQDNFFGDNPVCKVKKPVVDNRRMSFLTHDEAQRLLDEVRVHSVYAGFAKEGSGIASQRARHINAQNLHNTRGGKSISFGSKIFINDDSGSIITIIFKLSLDFSLKFQLFDDYGY